MEENNISAEESLHLINRMIHEGKDYFYETGTGPIVYGISVFVCSLLSYTMAAGFINLPLHPYYLLIPVVAIQTWLQYKEEQKKKAKTFTDEAIDYIWIGYFVATLVSLAAITRLGYATGCIVLMLTGLATFLTGMVAKFKYSIICGFVVWGLAAASFYMLNAGIYLLLAIMAVLVWLVPGLMMRSYFKKQQHG
jgi:hypothetical protein